MKKIISFFTLLLFFSSCLKHKTIEPASVDSSCVDTVYFNSELMPEIFTPSCNVSGCHNSTDMAGGYDLTTYTAINNNADIILQAIQQSGNVSPMPKFQPKLNDSLITKFDCWIKQGKLDN